LRLGTSTSESLALKLESLGVDAGGLELALQAVKHHVRVAAGADVIRAGDSVGRSTVLLTGVACIVSG